jgi:hypothetical protein
MRTIFQIQLENDRIFLYGRESDSTVSNVQICLEVSFLYEYARQNKPIDVLDKFMETSSLDLDYFVKKEMLKRGISNVRGGTYSAPILTVEQYKCLEIELQDPVEICSKDVLKEILDGYTRTERSKEELKQQHKELMDKYEKYKMDRAELDMIQTDIEKIRGDLEWIPIICEKQREAFLSGQTKTHLYRMERPELVARYRQSLKSLSWIYTNFMELCEFDDSSCLLPLKYPEFLLDDFIYHGHRVNSTQVLDNVRGLYSQYLYFLTWLENRIAERTFDVNSWGPEWKIKGSIALLEFCLSK